MDADFDVADAYIDIEDGVNEDNDGGNNENYDTYSLLQGHEMYLKCIIILAFMQQKVTYIYFDRQ